MSNEEHRLWSWSFELPICRLSVRCRQLARRKNLDIATSEEWNILKLLAEGERRPDGRSDPEKLRKELVSLIDKMRPDLRGGVVVSFDLKPTSYEILYIHPSLPLVMNAPLQKLIQLDPSTGPMADEPITVGATT